MGGDGGRAAPWGCNGAGPNSMVVLDSLSAALLRERPHVAGRKLRAAMGAGRGKGRGEGRKGRGEGRKVCCRSGGRG